MKKPGIKESIVIGVVCAVFAFIIVMSIVRIGTPGSSGGPGGDDLPVFSSGMDNTSEVWYEGEIVASADRRLPEVSDGGLPRYPEYGKTFSASSDEKQAIINENNSLVASSSTYDSMDADGMLYLGGEATGGRLYKHTAAAGMYEGDVSDDEPAVVKRITVRPTRNTGNYITGLYAPAGEVITVTMSEDDLAKTGGVRIYIGQALANGQANGIWLAKDFVRMPVILNTMTADAVTSYVGSFFGGPIYIRPVDQCDEFSVTISGAVEYTHFILGSTTKEEFERIADSTAPYFDLEVWDDGVRHSGPKSRAAGFGYEELQRAAVLWDKIALVSNRIPAGSGGNTGITFLYDPFVAAGSMVAFVGRHTVNCPPSAMTAALDERSATDDPSGNFWGCIHEFNHHYQKFGIDGSSSYPSEVTNNAVSLVSYSLFTRASARRAAGEPGEGSYADGWNRYTNPSWALRQTVSRTTANSGLDTYADLLHSFGQDVFVRSAAACGGTFGSADVWYSSLSDVTGYDMTYYFEDVLHLDISDELIAEYAAKDMPVFVPVATIFQTGRSFLSGGETLYSRTVQPYVVAEGEPFEFDLQGSIVAPEGIDVAVKSVSDPESGRITSKGGGTYIWTPDGDEDSGDILATVSLKKSDGAFGIEDVTFVLSFSQGIGDGRFESEYFYTHDYDYSHSEPYDANQTCISSVYSPWDANYPISVLFDDDENNYIHSDRTDISAENFFEVTVSLDDTVRANAFTVYGAPSRLYLPTEFELYGGMSEEDMRLLADETSSRRSGSDLIVTFPVAEVRVYRLHVTDTMPTANGDRYIAYRYAGFSYMIGGGKKVSPDDGMFVWRGDWKVRGALAQYGHVYESGGNAEVSFTFVGSRFAILAGGGTPEAYADGVRISFEAVGEDACVSGDLGSGCHTIRMICPSLAVDSFAIWS